MLSGFFVYHLVSLVLGVSALTVVSVLFLKTGNRRLPPYLLSHGLVLLIVLCLTDQLSVSGTGQDLLPFLNIGTVNYLVCALGAAIPVMGRPRILSPRVRRIERAFAAVSLVLGLLLGVLEVFGTGGAPFYVLYTLIYLDLALAILYFIGSGWNQGRAAPPDTVLPHLGAALKGIRILALVLLPAFLLVDFFGWMIPFMAALLPPGLSLLPLFSALMSVFVVVSSTREILDPGPGAPDGRPGGAPDGPPPDGREFRERHGLTDREWEVTLLVTRFLSYKEIGERLFIAPGTVRSHLNHVYEKTGARDRLDLRRMLDLEPGREPAG